MVRQMLKNKSAPQPAIMKTPTGGTEYGWVLLAVGIRKRNVGGRKGVGWREG